MKRQYVTTAIDYPNAAPHMGHVLEKVLADVCARWFRLRGDDVRFQIGTDEHGIKIQQTAEKQKLTPKELVDQNVPLFQDLYAKLNVSADHFVRTTDQVNHWPTVIELWKKLQANGALEKRTYTGLYCSGCERFVTKKDLVDGKCPDHNRAPDEVKEENYFFLLNRNAAWLKDLLTTDPTGTRIVPQFREKETLALLEQGLEDVSFSRPKTSLAWGIPVPGDDEQTMYVWCDALTNYISTLHYFTDASQRKYWDEAEVTHVIGKDIARFHALYWPAMLKEAGITKMPNRLLMHGFLTSEGQKMSKSLGNVVKPLEVLERFKGDPDPIRFYLSHEIPVGNDGDFSWKRFEELYDSKLRNQLGNMLNRLLVLLKKEGGNLADISSSAATELTDHLKWQDYAVAMNNFEVQKALEIATNLVNQCNLYIDQKAPWKEKDPAAKLKILTALAEGLRHISLMLLPFMPATAQKIAMQLNVSYAAKMLERNFVIGNLQEWGADTQWKTVGEPQILFPPLEKEEK
ncbi:MAG: methionine--tRNA ligase [Candidatus Peribacteraceae bacterium]|nr:methionine--tRNA ligase [Candidatus Peribacteraceae bacterium]